LQADASAVIDDARSGESLTGGACRCQLKAD
jgi:hypothetical protein